MRPTAFLKLALAASLLSGAGCYNLPTVDPGPRWIDQFNSLTMPTWEVFGPWSCVTSPIGSPDAGSPDAGGVGDCPRPSPGDGDANGLAAPFDLPDSSNDLSFTLATSTAPAGTVVDFTGFKWFVFSAKLESTFPSTAPIPIATTELKVELTCKGNSPNDASTDDPATQTAMEVQVDATSWKLVRLALSGFELKSTSFTHACLAAIDGIRFVVVPGNNDLPSVAGTLSLDNISLQN
jgi:hypothetical protein